MKARDSKRMAISALRFAHARDTYDGYSFSTLADIAGMPDLPFPSTVGPREKRYMPAYCERGADPRVPAP